jgi:hypothetical protein
MNKELEIKENEYILEEKIIVKYNALNLLNHNIDLIEDGILIEYVKIVCYKINKTQNMPYLSFMLIKNSFIEELNLFYLKLNSYLSDKNFIESAALCQLFSYFHTNNFNEFKNKTQIKGLFEYKKEYYIFIDVTEVEFNTNMIYKKEPLWFVLSDELANKKHVCNIPISNSVTEFFVSNNNFLFLQDINNKNVETPIVVYTGTHEKDLYFNYIFGKSKKDNLHIFGDHYYFTNFVNAIKDGGWSSDNNIEYKFNVKITEKETGKYIKGGVVRHAIFLGNCLYKENKPNDDYDVSEKKKELLKIDNSEKMTLRISDYDSLWENNYDSVFLGKIELDNGELMKNTPMYVIKEYHNQVSLSYHYIDKNYLKEYFDETINYQIQ